MPRANAAAPLRLACPACLGVVLESASVRRGVNLHHCGRCGGTWLLRAQIARLRTMPAAALRTMIGRRKDASYLCHGCHAPMHRDKARCATCKQANTLECPSCGKELRRQKGRRLTVDVCHGCEAVWLDHHELSALWSVTAAGVVMHSQGGTNLASAGADAGGFLLDMLWQAPELAVGTVRGAVHLAGSGIELVGHAASNAPAFLSSLPEMIGPALEAAGDVAGSVFGVILEIFGGLFDGI